MGPAEGALPAEGVVLLHGDNLDLLERLPADSIDAVVTDPPYGLAFMGKEFDKLGDGPGQQAFHLRWGRAVLRVLKPGGHLIAFGGTRTYHRLAAGLEDAGFEIRDCLFWAYGSGFPKSLDVGKAIDKVNGDAVAWRAFSEAYAAAVGASCYGHADIDRALGVKSSSCYWARTDHRGGMPPLRHWEKIKGMLGLPSDFDRLYDEAEREVVGRRTPGLSPGSNSVWGLYSGDDRITAPATDAARQWNGWGTALKPAVEPAVLARKPPVGTVAANVLTFGTGAINVDGGRVESGGGRPLLVGDYKQTANNVYEGRQDGSLAGGSKAAGTTDQGRWPANLIHDGSPEVVGLFPAKAGASARASGPTLTDGNTSASRGRVTGARERVPGAFHNDEGSAARFFYCAKAAPSERPDVTVCGCMAGVLPMRRDGPEAEQPCPTCGKPAKRLAHPTVKPVALMEYLIKLVTPPGGVVLDPFAGSGSTLVAAQNLGVRAVGMEREAEYIVIARSRLEPA